MNVTIGVALITSLSTLSAGALASYTSLRIHRRQVKAQQEMTLSEQAERESARRRQVRRDAYVAVLTHCDEISLILTECWSDEPDMSMYENLAKAKRLIDGMRTLFNVVYLEGPESVWNAARELQRALFRDFADMNNLQITYSGEKQPLAWLAQHHGKYNTPLHFDAKATLASAAREALE